jgi:beta-1,4-mannosyl-glycoprotein beta-1,4-N-acetylglucosaminyltransferase
MKIFDCTTFYSEDMMMDLRFNILNEFVHKFIVVESNFSHSGEKKKLNFNINNYQKFKDKIIYLVIEEEPHGLINIENQENKQFLKRLNSLRRIEQSYNYMQKGIRDVLDDDLVILSDNDEIPNLASKQFQKSSKDIFIFKQLFFYYKFNLLYDKMSWFGSKACKKKKLNSFSWLRNIKNKKYPIWRLDTYFSKLKNINVDIIDNGGWHFTNVKTPEDLFIKMKNFGHHDEFELSGLTLEDIAQKIDDRKVFYNHFVDKGNQNKWTSEDSLKIIDPRLLPEYLIKNSTKFDDWIAK